MKLIFPRYVLKRMIERGISVADVRDVLETGEVVERYMADEPPRHLMLGWSGKRPIHVVAEDDPVSHETTVVTAYEPDRKIWKSGFKERKGVRK
jgi:Domain of unknown function (DUF4258)